jgi:bacterioferritin-associated ferredoxin
MEFRTMYVCVCNGITEAQVRDAIAQGATSLPSLSARLGVTTGCGGCASIVALMLSPDAASVSLPEAFRNPATLTLASIGAA